ncbi:hypothetical protein ABZ611_12640 [Streptomyces sp. NPDC007861]|uniref:hypothetical protein n=1 Tax=Streptomyces sp. NPDC007861 TaxID=3154893 RepID=UPI0033F03590
MRFDQGSAAAPAWRVFDPGHLATAEVTDLPRSRRVAEPAARRGAARRGLPWKPVTEAGVGHVPAAAEELAARYGRLRAALSEVLGRGVLRP